MLHDSHRAVPSDTASDVLGALFDVQRLGVLCTVGPAGPYANLVGFVATGDLKAILFATPRNSRKYENLRSDGRASILIDDGRQRGPDDFPAAVAVTATGKVVEVASPAPGQIERYLGRHPSLREFLLGPDCALMRMDVRRYIIVRQLQDVTEFTPE